MRTLFFTIFVVVLAGLAGCQQQEKSKPADASQVAEEPAITARKSEATNVAAPSETADVSATVESEVRKQVEPAVEPAKTTVETTVSSREQETAPAKEAAETGSGTAITTEESKVVGDPVNGAKIAKGKCGACHFFDKDKKKVGPTLMGIYNRAPAIEGVSFATWDEAALDAWLADPKAVKPKTKMAFKGIAEKGKRDDLIAYLKTL